MPASNCVRVGVLSAPDSPYLADLQRAAAACPHPTELLPIRFNDMQCRMLGAGREDATVAAQAVAAQAEKEQAAELDAVIVRSMPLGSLEQVIFRMDCLQVWESQGVPVVNPPKALEVAIDKWLTLHRLQQAGVPVPATIACQSRSTAIEAFEILGGDVVVKPLFGGEGRGLIRVQEIDMAWRVFGTLQQVGQVLYVQKFCPHFGFDIRVLFIGDQTYSIKRRAVGDAWRTNLAQGSTAERHLLSETELRVAQQSAKAIGGGLLGVDLLPCRDGRLLVLEVNAVPGWRGLAKALDVDVAAEVISYVRRQAQMRSS